MAVRKSRLIFWLISAYWRRWGKIIIIYFFVGLGVFFLLLGAATYILPRLPITKHDVIGVVGAYTVDTVPEFILQDISQGLTIVGDDGTPRPGLASSWGIQDNGKTYIFRLRKGLRFTDGTAFTSREVDLPFKDVKVERPTDDTIIFHLKNSYVPFLASVSRPIFRKDFVGIGEYAVQNIKINGSFIQSMTLVSVSSKRITKSYEFYPSTEAVKIAFALGEITQARGLENISFKDTTLDTFTNAQVSRETDYSELVTLFYNNQDKDLSDKKLRDALAYTLPESFAYGERAYSPFSVKSWAYQKPDPEHSHQQDISHAKILLNASGFDTKNPITISTLEKYKPVAKDIIQAWNKIGVQGKIVIVTHLPSPFQVYLANFHEPKDPDQYTLWHSDQTNNITGYKNLRIDKLLEDGRTKIEESKRQKIYADFQSYIADDQPASFLYFPYNYTVKRK